jgi:hypothetical protein
MFPFIAVGLCVIGAASVCSWICNQLTDEEERKTERLYQERDNIYRRYNCASDKEDSSFLQRQMENSLEWRGKLLEAFEENLGKISVIAQGLDDLYKVILQEIGADSTSPYRRLALQQDYCRIEDAKFRLDAYREYLAYEKSRIDHCANKKDYTGLLALDPSEPLLPNEWMYPGKVVLLSPDEINTSIGKFGHKISFGKALSQNQALALPYGNEIPVLIKSRHKHFEQLKLFYGCVARGILYYKYIIEQQPAEMLVSESNRKYVKGSLLDEMISVNLPTTKLIHKHLLPVPGQRIMVYPDEFNVTLDQNPNAKGDKSCNRSIGVSELPPPQMGEIYKHPIYISCLENLLDQINDQDFYTSATQWQLIDYDIDSGEIVLGKSTVRLICIINPKIDGLTAKKVIQTEQIQSGVAIPFELTLISDFIDIR